MERIKIKNFRKIKETWELDLAPITFFTGTNNSGKSSVLKAVMALDDFGASRESFRTFHLMDGTEGNTKLIVILTPLIGKIKMMIIWIWSLSLNMLGYEVLVSFSPLVWENQKLLRGGVKHLIFSKIKRWSKVIVRKKVPNRIPVLHRKCIF